MRSKYCRGYALTWAFRWLCGSVALCLLLYTIPALPQRLADQPKSNVILVTIDTLRADHLGCYGYRLIETPHIDRLASVGARFTTVVA